MILVSEAIDIISREVTPLGDELAPLIDSVGRTLAQSIISDTDMPPFDRSQMDGYAVIAADTANFPSKLKLVGESAAGRGWHHPLSSGETVAIMTGAPIPEGADAVQKIELSDGGFDKDTSGPAEISILEPVERGRNIVKRGSEVKKGETLFQPGTVITEQMIATLAAFGYAQVLVARQPRVTILGTGSEIVPVDQTPGRDQIRNSNSVMLAAMAKKSGAGAEILPNVRDDLQSLKSQISEAAAAADVLIITGGVSVGKYDLTKDAIADLGAEIFFEKVRLKPGKPAVFGRLGQALIFGLPGNPVSAAVTFHLFVHRALALMQRRSRPGPRMGLAVLANNVNAAPARDTYLPSMLSTDGSGRLVAELCRWKGSSDFIGFSQAEALITLGRGESRRSGEVVPIQFL